MRLFSTASPVVALVAAALLATAPTPVQAQGAAIVRPGDVLRISVWKDADLSGEFEVAPDSTLRHPIYNRLKVGGLPTAGLQDRVREFLRTFHNDPQVEVEPMFRVTVAGEARSPQTLLVPAASTVGDVIAKAGGGTSEANLEKVQLERGEARRTVDVTEGGVNAAGQAIESGDRIVIPRRRNLLRDVVGPMSSVLGTVASLVLLTRR